MRSRVVVEHRFMGEMWHPQYSMVWSLFKKYDRLTDARNAVATLNRRYGTRVKVWLGMPFLSGIDYRISPDDEPWIGLFGEGI